ncbi:MAG: ferredoxin [Deltaproteobacteria bacterium]|jgi:ferredoxin
MNGRIPEVDRTTCIGCGLCTEIAPHTFALDVERLALVVNPGGDSEESIQAAIDDCPVAAISWQD